MSHSRPVARGSRGGPAPFTLHELRVRVAKGVAEEVGALMVSEGAGGVVEEPAGKGHAALVTYGDRAALEELARRLSETLGEDTAAAVRPAPAAVSGWETAFLEHLEPVRLGRTLRLVPLRDGEAPAPRPGDILLEPAVAFGFGEHPTTRMAARALERYCRAHGGASVLDVGTGTGVLALVAVRSGAGRAVGVDIDAAAVAAARSNARRNGLSRRCRFSGTPIGRVRGTFDVVVANVDRSTLLRFARSIAVRVSPSGALLLTGILPSDAAELTGCYGALGFTAVSRRREGDFALLELRPLTASRPAARRAPATPPRKARRKTRTPRSR